MIAMRDTFVYQGQTHQLLTTDLMLMLARKVFIVVLEFQNLKSVQPVCSLLQLGLFRSKNVTIANLAITVNMVLLKPKYAL